MNSASSVLDLPALRAVLSREFRAAFINRYFQIFAGLSLVAGISTALLAEDSNALGFIVMQIALYLVSLLALLAGLSSAQSERSEWPIMFAQPVSRRIFVLAKILAYLTIFGGGLLLLFIPAALAGSGTLNPTAVLYLQTLLLAATFLALGLACGFFAHDRAQALIAGITAWLVLLLGTDLVALFAARWSAIQDVPNLWVALLMLNPLDAFRIYALFALEQIPAEAANKTALASWWIAHAGIWCAIIATAWVIIFYTLATRRLNRWEE